VQESGLLDSNDINGRHGREAKRLWGNQWNYTDRCDRMSGKGMAPVLVI